MFDAIIAFSLRRRALVIFLTLALVAGGVFAFSRLPIDAVPDITNNQVQILTKAPALSSLEVERFVSMPVETALKSLPDVVELRSLSQPGLSVVTVVFPEREDTYFARQQIIERLRDVEDELPSDAEKPELAPVSTGLGEIFRYVVRDTTGRLSPMDLRTVQDWIIRRGLLGTPGIAEVNSLGGYLRQYHVLVDPAALPAYGITLREVFDAVARTSGNAGAGSIEAGPEQYTVRSVGLATGIDDLRSTVIRAGANGTPVTLGDVATVEIGHALRFGSASQDGKGEVVTGITMQLKGVNARVTVDAVKERIAEIAPSLPPGVVIEPYYDREDLVDRTIGIVIGNLVEGALLVIGVLLLFLVNLRAGVILASVIPLAMLFAGIMMVLSGQSGNLMSLGAIDFGLVVDGSLIIVENCLRLIEERYGSGRPLTDIEMRHLVLGGSVEVRKAAQFGEIIIIVVYLPILTLQGIEGKLFRPMALTVVYALLGALLLSVTYVPVMLSLFLKKSGRIRHSPIITWMQRHYRPLLARALGARGAIVGTTVLLLAAAVFVFTRLGGEFIPRLDEGDISLSLIRLPSISLTESQKLATRVERELMRFPEVKTVVSHTGRAEISTDPMGVGLADVFVILKPREQWTAGRSKEELIEAMSERLKRVPGIGLQFLQPIEMRFNELIAGVKGDVAVKVMGEDFDQLGPAAARIASILGSVRGGEDISVEQSSGQPQIVIRPDRSAIARYGLTVGDVNDLVRTAIGGTRAGEVAEGERRFDVVVRYRPDVLDGVGSIASMMVTTPNGQRVPLSTLAHVALEDGPAQISRENGSRFVTVQANVRGRDVESYVREVRSRIAAIKLPPGYSILYGGQFENLQAASRRLMIVVPIALGLIALLLFQTFRSMRVGLMIFLCVPMSIIGGVAALVIAGLPFSISAGVGFIALFGIAVLNGIVMVAAIRKYQMQGISRRDAVLRGAEERLRPVVTTAALAGFGFLPMMLAHGAGAEVQRPLATVIIGGLISSTLLTLVLLPIIYDWLGGRMKDGGSAVADIGSDTDGRSGAGAPLMKTAIVLLSIAIPAPGLRAQTKVTLEMVRQRALASSPEIRRSDAVLDESRATRNAVGILPNPDVLMTVDEAPSAALTGRSNTALGVAQSFELPFAYAARSRVAEILIERSVAEREVVRREVSFKATSAYVDLVAARMKLDLADSDFAAAGEVVRLTSRRRDLGESTALEPLQASIALANAERRRAAVSGELERAVAVVRGLMGAGPDEELIVDDRLEARSRTGTLAGAERMLFEEKGRLAPARLAVEASRADERAVAMQRYPSFSLEYSRQTVDGRSGFFGGALRVGLPLWRWFSDAPDREAEARTTIRAAELARDSLELLTGLRTAYAELERAERDLAHVTNDLLPLTREGSRIALTLFQQGEATYLEVLSAQSALIETTSAQVEALQRVEHSRAEVEFLVGGRTP